MATAFDSGVPVQGTEERFFFKLACAIALVMVAGFSFQLAAGRSSFAVPLVYHVHAFVFFGWIALFLTQSFLIAGNNVALHRRLGWLSAIWVPAMIVLGLAMTVASLRRNGGPFFFDANEFMIGNPVGILVFAVLVGAAVSVFIATVAIWWPTLESPSSPVPAATSNPSASASAKSSPASGIPRPTSAPRRFAPSATTCSAPRGPTKPSTGIVIPKPSSER